MMNRQQSIRNPSRPPRADRRQLSHRSHPKGSPAAVPSQPSERTADSSSIAVIRGNLRQPPHPRQPSQPQWNKSQLCCVVSKGSPLGRKLRCPYQKKLGLSQLSPPQEGEGLGGEGSLLGQGGDGVDRKSQTGWIEKTRRGGSKKAPI